MSAIVQQLSRIPTTCISDALQGLAHMDFKVKPLKDRDRLAGKCFTVQMVKGDNLVVLKAIREAKPGDVLVIAAQGDTQYAIAGDFILGLAQTLGIAGIVTDGVIRDIEAIQKLNFPVFCQGTTVAASGKEGRGALQIPISCGGITVHPGDIIFGDADGVVVVPQEQEEEIFRKSMKKWEADIARDLNVSGDADAVRRYLDHFLLR